MGENTMIETIRFRIPNPHYPGDPEEGLMYELDYEQVDEHGGYDAIEVRFIFSYDDGPERAVIMPWDWWNHICHEVDLDIIYPAIEEKNRGDEDTRQVEDGLFMQREHAEGRI